jgi:4'-phosphopantetheinyl transferase
MGAVKASLPETVRSAASLQDEVHLWVVDADAEAREAKRRRAATSVAERERAARFRRPEDGHRYLAAHGALRLILAGYLGWDPLALRFATGAWGKPFVEDTDIQFNLSHSGALALIAVARGRQVGVDVERLRPLADLEDVAARVCTAREREALAALAKPQRERAFLTLWTRKEALAKMVGEGVRALSPDARGEARGGRCRLVDVVDLSGYAACVAAEGTAWQLVRDSMDGR